MKVQSALVSGLFALGFAAVAGAQEIKLTVPGAPAEPAKAPVTSAAAPAAIQAPAPVPTFTEPQVIESLGWAIAQQVQLDSLKLSTEQLENFFKGIASATAEKELFTTPEKIGPVVEAFARKRQIETALEMKKAGKIPATAQIPPVPVFDPAGFTEPQILEAFGWFIARPLIEIRSFSPAQLASLSKGMVLLSEGKEIPYDKPNMGKAVGAFAEKRQAEYVDFYKKKNFVESIAYFTKLKENKAVIELQSGLRYEIVKTGEGAFPKASDTVKVTYTGKLINGKVFDSGTIDIPLDQVVRGWTEGVQKINKGGKIRLHIPPSLGYGDEAKGDIPPGSTLVFDVELLDFQPTPGPASIGFGK